MTAHPHAEVLHVFLSNEANRVWYCRSRNLRLQDILPASFSGRRGQCRSLISCMLTLKSERTLGKACNGHGELSEQGRADQPMDTDTSSGTDQAITGEVGQRIRSHDIPVPMSCSICCKRIWAILFTLREPAEAPVPQQSWELCKSCYAAVLLELEHSPVNSPLRLRIAAGIVAAERWPRLQPSAAEREDRLWTSLLLWGFTGCMLIHLVILLWIVHP